jgi:hypothetical protein
MVLEVADVLDRTGREIVQHVHLVALLDQQITQMRADEARTTGDEESDLAPADHREGVERRERHSTAPPKPPSARIAAPPPSSARIEPPPPEEACTTAAGRVGCGLGALGLPEPEEVPPRCALVWPEPDPGEPPDPGALIPAPNAATEELPLEEDWFPT